MPHDVRLNLRVPAQLSNVELDGTQIYPTAVQVNASVSQDHPTVTIELPLKQGEVNGEAVVQIPASTRDTLLALGWTPPKEEV